ncbi:uncharacterized protein TNCT_347491 [Trichonephila clavata]|uniref:Uncharacterized protein n=1 Tax=Trichonephila clavata TaxID=2740835 RepID=A0A8X6FFT1_TRICU|nr:uncharacterized protein TNCT_347491 [Trichonephila clavata]
MRSCRQQKLFLNFTRFSRRFPAADNAQPKTTKKSIYGYSEKQRHAHSQCHLPCNGEDTTAQVVEPDTLLAYIIELFICKKNNVIFFGAPDGTAVVNVANIEALKKSRKNEIATFTTAYNIVEELIALEGVDICELEAELNVFKGKVDRLENTHSNILELLPEKDYDPEFEIIEDFRDKAIRIQTKASRIMNGR